MYKILLIIYPLCNNYFTEMYVMPYKTENDIQTKISISGFIYVKSWTVIITSYSSFKIITLVFVKISNILSKKLIFNKTFA